MRRVSLAVVLSSALFFFDNVSFAQTQYDENALRLKTGWSASVVAGKKERLQVGVGMFPSGSYAEILAERSEEAADLYRSYRTKKIRGSVLLLASIGAIVGGAFAWDEHESTGGALVIGGLFGLMGSSVQDVYAIDDLSKSIWVYNGTLCGAPPTAPEASQKVGAR